MRLSHLETRQATKGRTEPNLSADRSSTDVESIGESTGVLAYIASWDRNDTTVGLNHQKVIEDLLSACVSGCQAPASTGCPNQRVGS